MQHVPVINVVQSSSVLPSAFSLKWVFSQFFGCRYVKNLMEKAGLTIREDPMGNIWGRLAGSETKAGKLTYRGGGTAAR